MDLPLIFNAADFDALGRDRRKLAQLHRSGKLIRLSRGTYIEAAAWENLTPRQRYGLRVSAFTNVAATEPVLCHATSALLHGLWVVGTPQKIHTIIETTTSGRNTKTVTRHRGSLSENVVRCGPFLLSDKLTTTVQLINKLSFPYAVAVCDSSLRAPDPAFDVNIFTAPTFDALGSAPEWSTTCPQGRPLFIAELRHAAQGLPGAAAQNRALRVIDFASPLSGSAGESISRAKMYQMGFPVPILQQRFNLSNGRFAEVDFWFEKQRVAGEFDGRGKYVKPGWGGRLNIEERVLAEKKREDQIRAQGVNFARWDWQEMLDGNRMGQILRQAGLPQGTMRRRPQ